jgi:hypothetical protein
MSKLPVARTEGLIVEEVSDEVLVYDEQSDKAHCLNHTASLIWKHCDGQTSAVQIAALLEAELKLPVSEQVVNVGLHELSRRKLLTEDSVLPELARLSRRRLVNSMGLTAMVALPLIISIVAPTAAQAGSPDPCAPATDKPIGCPCSSDNECNSFNCNAGVCGPAL